MTQVTGATGTPRARTETWLLDLVHRHRLSPTQRRVVQSMLDSLPDVAFMSTVDVAELAGVSQPTVVRLATALGFGSYPEFRGAVRSVALGDDTTPVAPASPSAAVAALVAEQANIAALERTLTSELMGRAVGALSATHPLGVIGIRASSALAQYMGHFAARILPEVRVLTDAASIDDDLFQLRDGGASAVLAYVLPRYPQASLLALRHAQELGMTTVVVADTHLLPFADAADVLLVAPVGADLVFDTHAAAMTLSTALLDGIARRDPCRTRRRLEAHEALARRWAVPE